MVTLSKLAKMANVSISTASKAFSMSPEVNEETRNMIFDIAKQHGCFKKFYKAKFPKLVIAIICPEYKSLYYGSLLTALQEELERRGCDVCVSATNFTCDMGEELFNYYSTYTEVDGIISIGFNISDKGFDFDRVPTVGIGSSCPDNIKCVMSGALEQAILYFKRRGVRDIGFIGESLTGSKLRGFRETMEKFSLEIDEGLIGLTEKRFSEGGYAAMSRMLDDGGRPRALICAYDSMAIGAMRCIRERGLRIPEDIAIIGMDDIPVAKYLYPSLSSIDLKSEEIAASATMAIIGKILGKSYEIKPISATLNLRESSNL